MGLSTGLYVLGMLLGLAVQRALVGTRCANSHVDCRNGLKILLSSFTWFILSGNAIWLPSGCLLAKKNANHCNCLSNVV